MSYVKPLNSTEEFAQLLGSAPVVLVAFSATWCGPCKAMAPAYENHAAKYAGLPIVFGKIDIAAAPDTVTAHAVRAVPTIIAFLLGKEVWRSVSYPGAVELNAIIDDLLLKTRHPDA